MQGRSGSGLERPRSPALQLPHGLGPRRQLHGLHVRPLSYSLRARARPPRRSSPDPSAGCGDATVAARSGRHCMWPVKERPGPRSGSGRPGGTRWRQCPSRRRVQVGRPRTWPRREICSTGVDQVPYPDAVGERPSHNAGWWRQAFMTGGGRSRRRRVAWSFAKRRGLSRWRRR